jgi:thiamine biosynthesis protein ThiS
MSKIKITINGKRKEVSQGLSVNGLLKELEVTGTMFVVEQNLKIVNKEDYATTPVNDNDTFELVGFFGGG